MENYAVPSMVVMKTEEDWVAEAVRKQNEKKKRLSLRAFGLYCFMASRGKTIPAETVSCHVKEGSGATKTAMSVGYESI